MKSRLLPLAAVVAGIASAQPSPIPDVSPVLLTKNGVSISAKSYANRKKGNVRFVGEARNESGRTIRFAQWCIRASQQKAGCLLSLNNRGPWEPGATETWDYVIAAKGNGLPKHYLLLDVVTMDLNSIQRVFVGPIGGGDGGRTREQLKALLTNSGRFELVEAAALAEAFIVGWSEVRETGAVVTSMGGSAAIETLSTAAAASESDSLSRTVNVARSESTSRQSMVIRLVSPMGDTIWAWDDTQRCQGSKTKCAIDSLVITSAERL